MNLMENLPAEEHKSGFVAVMGRPNVGKSTLINALMGQKIAAVSPRPQTTRKRQLGIMTTDSAQVIFVDTPGVHNPRNKLGEAMNQQAKEALEEVELILFLVDASEDPTEEDRMLAALLQETKRHPPVLLVLNKMDLVNQEELEQRQAAYMDLAAGAYPIAVSATQGENLDALFDEIVLRLPEGPEYYPEGQVTDFYERDIAADLIREAALIHLRDEIPHGITVRIDEYQERNETGAYIAATIIVERESHKGIVIGQGGSMLKQIGSDARREIERMSGRSVYLRLRVKVRKNWRNDEKALRWYGY